MNTVKTIIKKDTVNLIKGKSINIVSERHITTETITYKDQGDWLLKLCDCKLLSDILWPLTILIILFSFKKQLQKIIDSIGERIKKGDAIKLGKDGIEIGQELSRQEINEKAQNEYNETIKETSAEEKVTEPDITQNEFVPNYLNVEKRIFEVLLKFLYPRYRILSNRRIQGYEYDLIIETLNDRDHDYVVEVKYYPNRIRKLGLQDLVVRLMLMKNVYENTLNRSAIPALIIVTKEENTSLLESEMYKLIKEPVEHQSFIKLLIINQNEIERLTLSRILSFLD